MIYFKVINFEKFQHYKDRNPPWIKLYNGILGDYEYQKLNDASRSHLFAIWLLASRYENKIPYDPVWIAKQIFSTTKVDLKILEDMKFIEKIQGCSNMLATCKQHASNMLDQRRDREETETETEVRASRSQKIPDDFSVSEKIRDWAKREGTPDPDSQIEAFRDFYKANGKLMKDWEAAFRGWLRKAKEFSKPDKQAQAKKEWEAWKNENK